MPTAKKDETEAVEEEPERKLAKVRIELRDESDSTLDSITKLIAAQGGQIKQRRGRIVSAEAPAGTDRDPTNAVARFVSHLRSDPLVLEVEHD